MKAYLYDKNLDIAPRKVIYFKEDGSIINSEILYNPIATSLNRIEFSSGYSDVNSYFIVVDPDRDESTVTDQEKLDFWKFMKIQQLSHECEKAILNGFTSSNNHQYGFSQFDQINFIQKLLRIMQKKLDDANKQISDLEYRVAMLESQVNGTTPPEEPAPPPPSTTIIEPFEWKTLDAGLILHTFDDFCAVCDSAESFKVGLLARFWQLEQQVKNATTLEEVDAINWE